MSEYLASLIDVFKILNACCDAFLRFDEVISRLSIKTQKHKTKERFCQESTYNHDFLPAPCKLLKVYIFLDGVKKSKPLWNNKLEEWNFFLEKFT